MFLGVLFGSDGVLKISYDDYDLTSKLCSIGLLFIIFYGGFCTKKPENKKVGIQAALLSSVGTILTALFCAAFCFYVLKIPFAERMFSDPATYEPLPKSAHNPLSASAHPDRRPMG